MVRIPEQHRQKHDRRDDARDVRPGLAQSPRSDGRAQNASATADGQKDRRVLRRERHAERDAGDVHHRSESREPTELRARGRRSRADRRRGEQRRVRRGENQPRRGERQHADDDRRAHRADASPAESPRDCDGRQSGDPAGDDRPSERSGVADRWREPSSVVAESNQQRDHGRDDRSSRPRDGATTPSSTSRRGRRE